MALVILIQGLQIYQNNIIDFGALAGAVGVLFLNVNYMANSCLLVPLLPI